VSAHTPGPWTTVDESAAGPRGDVSFNHQLLSGDLWLASISSGDFETRELVAKERPRIEANLRLIAAAPELLTALRGLYDLCPQGHLDDKRGLWADAWAAIAKAEGQ
jgi:hypothetical protein